jgi:AcrR family transcriptional regulator
MSNDAVTRPPRADALRNRARVLEAARDAFEAEGLAVNVDVIARRAGVGVGTVYRHFPTKEALFAAIVVMSFESFVAEARELARSDDPGEALYGFLARVADQSETSMAIKDALGGESFDIEANAGVAMRDLEDAVGVLLVRAQEAGATRADIGIDELFALIGGACQATSPRGASVISRQHLVAVICDGLRPPPARA